MNLVSSSVIIQCKPQFKVSFLAIVILGVKAIIGTFGLSREVNEAVVPVSVKQQMTLILVVSATSLAATVIASETSPLRGVLEDSIT